MFDDANKPGKLLPDSMPRQNFYHWILLDIPTKRYLDLAEGRDSKNVVPGGKLTGKTAYGTNGKNDYAKFYRSGSYGGYDGPCPPWNDLRFIASLPFHRLCGGCAIAAMCSWQRPARTCERCTQEAHVGQRRARRHLHAGQLLIQK